MGFFAKYRNKSDGAIRFYDMRSRGMRAIAVLIFAVCVLMLVVALFPVLWAFLSSFKSVSEFRNSTKILPEEFDFADFRATWEQLGFVKNYINSLIAVTGGVVCAVLFNGLLAYVLAILKPWGYRVINGLVMWSLMIPPVTSVVALFMNIRAVGLTNSFLPLWLSMGANAFWVMLFKQFFQSLPKDYIEAARLDGCSNLQIFARIVLPLSRSIIAVVALFAVTAAWSDFLLPYLLLGGGDKETVMVRLFSFRTNIRATSVDVLRASIFAIIPPAIVFAIFQKQITNGAAAGGIKG